ncbi:MAG: hypothetical protein IJ272_02540 [Clostridia bacterium]|nr:hypothetical protein [Clostridia bacterium]
MKNKQIEKQMKHKMKLKNNRYVYLKLNRRNASLIINSLAFVRRYLYYNKVEEIPIEIFFDKKDFQQDFFDLTISMVKITEDCKKNFYNWKEFKIYKK